MLSRERVVAGGQQPASNARRDQAARGGSRRTPEAQRRPVLRHGPSEHGTYVARRPRREGRSPRSLPAAALGGGIATAVDVTTLVLLVHAGVAVALAAFSGATIGAVTCFAWNKYVAFRDRSPITVQQLGRFGIVAVATALLMAFAMHVVAVKLGVPLVPAKLGCSAAVFLAWTFPAQRRLVFQGATS